MPTFNPLPSSPVLGNNRPSRWEAIRAGGSTLANLLGLEAAGLAVDFAGAMMEVRGGPAPYLGPLAGKLTYSGSAKYRRNPAGVYVSETGIIPGYDINGQNIGTRFEPQDVNRLLWSSDLSNAAWARNSMPTAPEVALGPDGAMSAWTLTDDQGSAYSSVSQAVAVTADTGTHQVRVRIKKALAATTAIAGFNLYLTGGTTVSAFPRIDPYSGAGVLGAVVTDAGEWWEARCPIANNGTNNALTVYLQPASRTAIGSADSSAAIGSNTFWCPQSGDNFVSSSPIMTNAAQVTRAADVLYMLLSALPWDADEGTLIVRSRTDAAWGSYSPSVSITGPGTAITDTFAIAHNYLGTTTFSGSKNSVEQFRLTDGAVSNAFVTSAAAWAPNDVAFTRNGGAVTLTDSVADTNLTVADRLYLGSRGIFNWLQGHVLWALYLPRRVTNAELQALSALA